MRWYRVTVLALESIAPLYPNVREAVRQHLSNPEQDQGYLYRGTAEAGGRQPTSTHVLQPTRYGHRTPQFI